MKSRRRYERVRPRSPQPCGPRDNYALLYYVPKMTWEQVGQDDHEAVRRRAAKVRIPAGKARAIYPARYHTQGSLVLEELRSAVLAMKKKERKRDRMNGQKTRHLAAAEFWNAPCSCDVRHRWM